MQVTLHSGDLNAFDWFLIVVVGVSTILAFGKGFIKALLSIGGLILGIVIASWNYVSLARTFSGAITSLAVAQVVAFIAILLVVMVVVTIVAGLLRKTVAAVGLGFLDRLLGAIFGFVRGALLGTAAMMAMTAFYPGSPWIVHSQLAPYFLQTAHAVSFIVPEHFKQQIAEGTARFVEANPDLLKPHTLTQPAP